MEPHNWTSLAANRWPNAQIHGHGRFALKSERGEIYLYPLKSQADASAPFHNSRVWDLMPCPVLDHDSPDIGYDREERRKARQGKL
jgi:hypothetical protein